MSETIPLWLPIAYTLFLLVLVPAMARAQDRAQALQRSRRALEEMVVEGIGIDPHNQPLVLLRDADRKTFLPIWIGPFEADAIALAAHFKAPILVSRELLDKVGQSLEQPVQPRPGEVRL